MGSGTRYPIDQSPLFRLTSKRKLAALLSIGTESLAQLATGLQYNVFRNDRGRWIQHPIGALGSVHKRLARLLARIALPEYMQAQKGGSYVRNARTHIGNVPVIKTDLTAYYPSVKFTAVFRLFCEVFRCAPDVAWLLARISTFRGEHVPTGSEISGLVAFLSNRKMFDDIHALATEKGCRMTCYVDDIVLSGDAATKRLLVQIRRIAAKHGMATKDEKSKAFPPHSPKVITGCIVKGDKLLLPNSRHYKIAQLRRDLQHEKHLPNRDQLESSLRGRLQEARQVDPSFT